MNNKRTIGAIILAAGKGKRMQSQDTNKVVFPLGDKPMILHIVQILESLKFSSIIVVVGFAKESVKDVLKNTGVVFAEQKNQLGTGNATSCGLEKVSQSVTDLLVFNGDDSAFYSPEIIKKLIDAHITSDAEMTFLTLEVENPFGLGRILRNNEGKVVKIVEEKDALEKERMINEINPACYMFKTQFLKKYLPEIQKSKVTGEYYLVSLVDLAAKNNEKMETLKAGKITWRGVNTREELAEAHRLFTTQ